MIYFVYLLQARFACLLCAICGHYVSDSIALWATLPYKIILFVQE